jgi:hypothetical protein
VSAVQRPPKGRTRVRGCLGILLAAGLAGCALGGADCVVDDARCVGTVRQVCVAGAWQPAEDCAGRGPTWECRQDYGPGGARCGRWAW